MVGINQFGMTTEQGVVDLNQAGFVIAAQISGSEAGTLVAGQAVKRVNSLKKLPEVTALTSNADEVFGFIAYNQKDAAYTAGEPIEVALENTVMYMTAGAAIAAGAPVEVVYTTSKVITNAGVNPVAGFALDRASADGDLIRVVITPPAFSDTRGVKSVNVTATLAEINAGKELIPAIAGKSIKVISFTSRVTGAFTTTTSVDIQSSNAVPVKVAVHAVAGLTNGAVITSAPTANTTLGAGFSVPLGSGDALRVANVGAAAAGGTSIQFTINYTQS